MKNKLYQIADKMGLAQKIHGTNIVHLDIDCDDKLTMCCRNDGGDGGYCSCMCSVYRRLYVYGLLERYINFTIDRNAIIPICTF